MLIGLRCDDETFSASPLRCGEGSRGSQSCLLMYDRVLPEPRDLVLDVQFTPFEFDDL